ncbi:MAG TPA: DUF4157 domain-containing protein [Pyrinomonadaceae bacterium]|jgi:hypothetical protein
MRDYDRDRAGANPDNAPQKKIPAKTKETGAGEAAHKSGPAAKPDAGHADAPAVLQQERLSHPANAGQLAGILSELQQSHGNAYVQQVVSGMNEPEAGVEAPSGTGQKLDDGVKSEMESAFGESFGDVRIHTGNEAQKMNEELGAHAVTRGRDIYFEAGKYNPATREGKELLAHELTHVVQQGGDAAKQQAGSIDGPGDKFEEEADRTARAVLSGERAAIVHRSATPSCQRYTPTRQPQQPRQPQQTPPTVLLPMVIDLSRHPSGALAVGLTYNYSPPSPSSGSQYLEVWVPAGGTATPMSGPITKLLDSSPFLARPVLIEVPRIRGQAPQIVIRFTTVRWSVGAQISPAGTNQLDVRFIFPVTP